MPIIVLTQLKIILLVFRHTVTFLMVCQISLVHCVYCTSHFFMFGMDLAHINKVKSVMCLSVDIVNACLCCSDT
jgi:hypothetical protein